MKYRDLIQFVPINEVVRFDRLSDASYQESLVRTFVFSKDYENTIIPYICSNLDYTTTADTFGLQIVGNYGTGKSHLMSLFTLIAENADYLTLLNNDKARDSLAKIAGKYKVHRFELGNTQELWDIVCYEIDKFLAAAGINYSITESDKLESYQNRLRRMMAHFEEKYPDKGFLLVIDEMLTYLQGRAGEPDKLSRDLGVLQALGQMSDHSKFRMVFGVQELIYNVSEFQFAANMLNKVNDRYKQITITKQDVKFVTEQRLLGKTDDQRAWIRSHLMRFTQFFSDLHANLEEYVNLFPVHPAFFDNFQLVQVRNGQREILKTLSSKFEAIVDREVPDAQPGLISYDSYWADLTAPRMQTDPDVRRINEIMAIISQKIDENFVGPRAGKNALAHRIANACAVKILQSSLAATNGVTAETLVDDLCYLDPNCFDRDILRDVIDLAAKTIVTATVGQYFEKNEFNQEYHLRIVGGINYEQKIKDYAAQMQPEIKNQYYYNFLTEYLPIETETYRREFKIWSHRIDWNSHKTMIDGYIFMGNPNERSTTQPQQHFYIYFTPVFTDPTDQIGNEEDSVYFAFTDMSQEMKEYLVLFAAAESLKASADTSEKRNYDVFVKKYKDELRRLFNSEFRQNMRVYYRGQVQTLSPDLFNAPSKEMAVSKITSFLLEDHFNVARPDYPRFTALRQPLTADNFDTHIKQAKQKIANPSQSFSNGEAILYGLGLLKEGHLSTDGSIYAQTISRMLADRGPQQVINRDDVLECFWADTHSYRSRDFGIEADFEYLVLATMVALGEIEIRVSGKTINAANIGEIVNCPKEEYYCWDCLRRPRGLDFAAMRELSLGLTGIDLSAQIPDTGSGALAKMLSGAKELADRCARAIYNVQGGISFEGIDLIPAGDAISIRSHLAAIKGVADKMQSFTTAAKLKNYPYDSQQLREIFSQRGDLDRIDRAKKHKATFSALLSYLNQAKQYIIDTAFLTEIDQAINRLRTTPIDDAQAIEDCRRNLEDLRLRYAHWYIGEYNRCHINNLQESERQQMLNSDTLQLLRMATKSNYVAIDRRLQPWLSEVQRMRPAQSISIDIMRNSPYRDFNPKDYAGKSLPSLADLRQQLNDIYEFADEEYHKILDDPNLLRNLDALSDQQRSRLESLRSKPISLQSFPEMMQIIERLNRGITMVRVRREELLTLFDRSLTPAEAISTFTDFVNAKLDGIDRSNARITLE